MGSQLDRHVLFATFRGVVRIITPSRTAWLALAALGLAAGVLATTGSSESTPPAGASTASAAGPAPDIRSIDFGEVAPPGSACVDALRFTPPVSIPVARGRSLILDIGRNARLEVDPDVAYGDLDGDGDDEAVVHVVCNYGANGAQDSVHVWTLSWARPVHVASVNEPPASLSGGLPPTVAGVAVDGDRAAITWTRYSPDDPHCCPSQLSTVSYALDGRALDRVGRAVISTAG